MDGLIEKFCYCSFNLCNTADNRIDKVTLTTQQSQHSADSMMMQNVTLAVSHPPICRCIPHPCLQWRIVGCNDLWCGAGDDDACHDT